jgi:CubicO group peptidase (beta-lactamase class C family)
MCLVAAGDVELEAPVRRYLPELRLPDERLASTVTVLQCLNHTGGWSFQLPRSGSDPGDGALAASVESMAETAEFAGHGGGKAFYNNAGFALAGRIVEKVTGSTFEAALRSLLFEPLGLAHTSFDPNEVMTRRFAVGHAARPDGPPAIGRAWNGPRAINPWGGIATSVTDGLAWARFHLGDGPSVLPAGTLTQMQEPTAELHGAALGDAVGIGWMLRDICGSQAVGHDGSMQNQYASLLMVPSCRFAVVSATNCGPNGLWFNQDVVRWALSAYAGLEEPEPEPVADPERALAFAGTYENEAMRAAITTSGGKLVLDLSFTPAGRERMGEEVPDFPPSELGLLADKDQYILLTGPFKGFRGAFLCDDAGEAAAFELVGRVYPRVGSR